MKHLRARRWHGAVALALLGIGFGLRVWWALAIEPRQVSDARTYPAIAAGLAEGQGYRIGGLPTAYFPIGYPLLLAGVRLVFGTTPSVARMVNAVCGLITLYALFALARALTNSRASALLTLLLFVLYPADIGFTAVTLSQAIFNTLGLAGCALCLSSSSPGAGRLLTAGVLLGWATLTRHQGAVLVALIAVAWLLQPKNQRSRPSTRIALLLAAFLVTMTPWTVRNALGLRGFVPIATNGGVNLYIGNNPRATGRYNFSRKVVEPLMAAAPNPKRGGHNEVVFDRHASRLAWQYVAQHPKAALALWPRKLGYLYLDDDGFAAWLRKLPDRAQIDTVARANTLNKKYYVGLLGLGAIGACSAALELMLRRKTLRSLLWFPAAVVFTFTALHMLTFGSSTYHHPMMPWIVIYAGYALSSPWRYAGGGSWWRRGRLANVPSVSREPNLHASGT
jgi:4-amino-4-deoxy-L-arabinose transferase-like glycosyltransferase